MKSHKFIQLYDKDERPILSRSGQLKYDRRSKTPDRQLKSLREAKKLPIEATHYAIHQTILQSIQKLTGIQPLPVNDTKATTITR